MMTVPLSFSLCHPKLRARPVSHFKNQNCFSRATHFISVIYIFCVKACETKSLRAKEKHVLWVKNWRDLNLKIPAYWSIPSTLFPSAAFLLNKSHGQIEIFTSRQKNSARKPWNMTRPNFRPPLKHLDWVKRLLSSCNSFPLRMWGRAPFRV